MKFCVLLALLTLTGGSAAVALSQPVVDPELSAFIAKIRAVDNHAHANSIAPDDAESDALHLEEIAPFTVPVTLQPDHPNWLAAYKALYEYPHAEVSDAHLDELRATMGRVRDQQGERFPAWVLDKIGTEVMLANRVAMGPGLAAPRFRWVAFVDALMLPLSTRGEAAASPDRAKFYPAEEKLLERYLTELKVAAKPGTLTDYLRTVVTPTLEAQQRAGCLAVKFEAALFRSLDFAPVTAQAASAVYAKYVKGGEPPAADYKALQDYIFRYIAREAGRLGMAVHIHSFEGPGNYYRAAGADPLLLEPAINDSTLRHTNFVVIHGGGVYASHTAALFWKPNVYADISAMALIYPPEQLAAILRGWLTQFPDRVLFGTDAATFGPEAGWELTAWIGTTQARRALAMALTEMIRAGEVNRTRAQEIATMVMRTNASRLYKLGLP
ncbi:MAG TPA: hypothetical protein VNM87_06200 [Candidatus Udaeobacter sp.]|nr:hypothetical protein [Candidatus Udaeobacter sp.]